MIWQFLCLCFLFLQVLSNTRYKSVLHRAAVNSSSMRLSLACFLNPPLSATVEAPAELITEERPQVYRPFTWLEYLSNAYKFHPANGGERHERFFLAQRWYIFGAASSSSFLCHIICPYDFILTFGSTSSSSSSSLLLNRSPSHHHRWGLADKLGRVIVSCIELGKNPNCSKPINIWSKCHIQLLPLHEPDCQLDSCKSCKNKVWKAVCSQTQGIRIRI